MDAWDSVLLWVSCMVFFQPLFRSSLFWELTCASLIVPSRTHPPAPGNAAAPERLEALKYQRIKKPKKSSKGSSKSKKRSGKWRILSSPLSADIVRLFGSGSHLWVFSRIKCTSLCYCLFLI